MTEVLSTHTPALFAAAVARAVERLRAGELVALPTETVYGLAANALDPRAVARIFEAKGPNGQRFTLSEPWSVMLLDDARMIHETTPIQPTEDGGWRDTLVVTCRGGGFQGDASQ